MTHRILNAWRLAKLWLCMRPMYKVDVHFVGKEADPNTHVTWNSMTGRCVLTVNTHVNSGHDALLTVAHVLGHLTQMSIIGRALEYDSEVETEANRMAQQVLKKIYGHGVLFKELGCRLPAWAAADKQHYEMRAANPEAYLEENRWDWMTRRGAEMRGIMDEIFRYQPPSQFSLMSCGVGIVNRDALSSAVKNAAQRLLDHGDTVVFHENYKDYKDWLSRHAPCYGTRAGNHQMPHDKISPN